MRRFNLWGNSNKRLPTTKIIYIMLNGSGEQEKGENMLSIEDEEFLEKALADKYENEKVRYAEAVEAYNTKLFAQYKSMFPFCFVSHQYIKNFLQRLSFIKLLPEKEEYISINKENEFFEVSISFSFRKGNDEKTWIFPYPINIHKIKQYIFKNSITPVSLDVPSMKNLIIPERFEEVKQEIKGKQKDLLASIKKDNPIIVLYPKGIVEEPYLINGNHRIVQAMIDGKNVVKGYIFSADICSICGMTENFELLYKMMQGIYTKVHGVSKQNKY